MVLVNNLISGIHYHFVEKGLSECIYRNDNAPEFIQFEIGEKEFFGFTFSIIIKKLEVLVSPVLGRKEDLETNEEVEKREQEYKKLFQKYIEENEKGVDPKKYPSLRKSQNSYRNHLGKREFSFNGEGNYHFSAEFASNNSEKALYSVLNWVVKPVLLFSREKRKEKDTIL